MLSRRPMDPILHHSDDPAHDPESGEAPVVQLTTQANKMRLRENQDAPGYQALTPQTSPGKQAAAAAADGSPAKGLTGAAGATGATGDLDPYSGPSHAAGAIRDANMAGRGGSSARDAWPKEIQRPQSTINMPTGSSSAYVAANASRSTPVSPVHTGIAKIGSGASTTSRPAGGVGPGATGLASVRRVDVQHPLASADGAGTPPQFIFAKLGSRRPSEYATDRPQPRRKASEIGSPVEGASGAATPSDETLGRERSIKKKDKDKDGHGHHNPLLDLRRVSA